MVLMNDNYEIPMATVRTLPRILFLNGIVDEVNTANLMAMITNINIEDDIMLKEATEDLVAYSKDINIVEVRDDYPKIDKLADGTVLALDLCDELKLRPTITLHIKSGGGYVEDGMALINMIRTSKTPINAIVHFGHSMAFAIASACDYRIGFPTTRMMIHDMGGGFQGTTEQLIRETENSKILRSLADQVIIDNTKLTQQDLDEMNESVEDRFFTGQELLDFGLLDEINGYNTPEHKIAEMNKDFMKKFEDGVKLDVIMDIIILLSDIETKQMLIDEIYDLMDDENVELIGELMEGDKDISNLSYEELEAIFAYVTDFGKEDEYDVH